MLQDNEFLEEEDEAKPPSRENGTSASASSLPPESPNVSFPSSSIPTVQHFLISTLDGHLKLTASLQQNLSTSEQIPSSQQGSHQNIVKLINTSTPQGFAPRTANMHPLETSPLHQQTSSTVSLPEITCKQEPSDSFVPCNLKTVHSYSLSSSSSGVLTKDPKLIIKGTLKRHLSNSHVHSDSSVNSSNSVIPTSDSNKPKRLKMEENSPSKEIVNSRNFLIEHKRKEIQNLKREYQDHLTELFFLQSGGNMLDYMAFKKTRNHQLDAFLKSNLLDDNDEIFPCDVPIKTEDSLSSELQESIIESNAKSLSNTPISSPTIRPSQTLKQKSLSPNKLSSGRTQSISAVYDSTIGSQEEIVERAKQEAYVMQRISELRKEGLWSSKRLPKVQEMPRAKTHWDYLLEEMAWLATDFAQERKWKKNAAKKCARMVYKYHQDKESKAEREEKEEHQKLRRIASTMAKEVKQFWSNIEKVAEYKQQTWLEEKRKKALDLHLNFIVDQTEKFSSWLTEGLSVKKEEDTTLSSFGDNEKETFPKRNHDSLVIEEEDSNISKKLKLSTPDSSDDEQSDITDKLSKDYNDEGHDDDFKVNSEEEADDDETTLLEQEKHERNANYKKELEELQELGEMPLEDLYEMYARKAEESERSDESASSLSETDDDEYESEISEESEADIEDTKEDIEQEPSKDITDIAATAESFQPKGNTLSTTQVQTVVPFLLKHTLREYQHIGLDWLVAMQAKGLNGILADEMGLGKTIQTIALLAHLACERGIWGPHLIVVPTSVMLNWEMEIKKWCPAFKIITYFGNPKERKKKREGWTKFNAFHICITSYKLVIQDHPSFRRMRWVYFILDEAQHIKNFKSQRWQMLLNFQSSHRLLLTGTPLQNNLMELWSLMHFLMPNVFQSHKEFRDWFANPVTGMIEGNQDYNENLIKRLHKVLRPFLLRRVKSEVEKQLPKKYEHVVMCRLSKRQRYLYDDFMSQTKTKETLASGNFMSVINILMQLRKVCNHPNMFESRPIVSPFMMEGIICNVPSLILKALSYDPLKRINLWSLNLLLTEIELSLSAFAAHSIQKYKTPERLILDITPPPPAPPPIPAGKIKLHVRTGERPLPSSPIQQQQKIVVVSPRASSPPPPRPEYSLHLLQTSQPAASGVSLSQISSSNPITVQIQQAGGGAKISLPLGIGRVVQTTSGQHILLTPLSENITTAAQPGISSGQAAMVVTPSLASTPLSTMTTNQVTAIPSFDNIKKKTALENSKSSDTVLERITQKKHSILTARHQLLAHVNKFRCGAFPTYGSDLISAVTIRHSSNSCPRFASYGHLICKQAHTIDDYWSTTHCLQDIIVPNPESYLTRLMPIITRYVFVVPPVTSPSIQLHAHHYHPSNTDKYEEEKLFWELNQRSAFLHPIISNTRTQFPELRLIQYDCGKLQTLDKLLWQLKQENHRVLIFTQMTRMLDIMEQFLNYHGHTYLRLDGATRVDQRQVMMERFNADKRIFCFILSTRSGGIGVNLTGADTVIFYDSDWNPTMDAQAQDRCHRIGQTRDVHIYRLVSEKTVEENILKKANQKRLLGDLAIEGGNFTTAFFKKDTIRDLFDVDLEEDQSEHAKDSSKDASTEDLPPEKFTQQQLEQALGMAEEESDLQAATTARAEAAAELAEFDESIPLEGNASEVDGDKTQAEEELDKIMEQLTPVERYALRFLESIHEPFSQEQLKQAEEEIEAQKKDWELGRLKAIKEEEERLAAVNMVGPDDPLLTMARTDDTLQEFMYQNEVMPMWTPPTPPQEEEDGSSLYIDHSLGFLYETSVMPESLLPPLFVKKESKKLKALPVSVNRKQKVRCKEETVHIPRSLFDRPSAAILKMRKEVKLQKVKSLIFSKQGTSPGPGLKTGSLMVGNKPTSAILDQDSPEWLIHEDWTILQVIQEYQQLPLNLVVVSPAHTPNWDLVADCLGGTRSPRQARARYENVILPREEGRLLYDARKHKKCKGGIYKTKNTRPMRTSQLYLQDNNSSFTSLYLGRYDMIRTLSGRRSPNLRRWPGNSKTVAKSCILAESGIAYDQPLSPIQVALIRAERIARDKQNKQNAANAAQMPPVVTEGPVPVPKPAPPPTAAQIAAAAALPQQTQQPVTNISPSVIATLQNIQAKNAKPLPQGMVMTTTSAVPVTFVASSETVAVSTNTAQQLTAVAAQRLAGVPAALRQQSTSRNLTPSQVQAYRQTTILRTSQQRIHQEQQLKRFQQQQQQQQHVVAAATTKLNAPRVTHSEGEMPLIKRQQPQQQFTAGQILAATSQTLPQGTATLVKSGGNQPVAIPVSAVSAVNISVQQPSKVNKNQLTAAMPHQIRHLQLQPHIFRSKTQITKSQMGTVQIMQTATPMTGNKAVMQQILKQVVPISASSGTGGGEIPSTRVISVSPQQAQTATLKQIQVVTAPPPSSSTTPTLATLTTGGDKLAGQPGTIVLDSSEDGKKIASTPHTLRLRKP